MIELRKINEDNFNQVINIKTNLLNKDFVDDVINSLAEAWLDYNDTHPFAIYEDNKIIGFVSMYLGDNNYQIINFVIDEKERNKGKGENADKLCIDYLKSSFNAKIISIPVHVDHISAIKLWGKLGFKLSNTIEDNYIFIE